MHDGLSPERYLRIQALAAAGRAEIERHVFQYPSRRGVRRITMLRICGAVAIGILSAGLAIVLTAVVLNLVFHYVPS